MDTARAISPMRDYNAQQLNLIRRTVAKDTTPEEFDMFIEICRRQQLDPFRKQIHALVFNKDKPDKRQVAFITAIDGYRAMAARAGNYRPDENDPDIVYDKEMIDPATNPKGILKASVTVWQHAHGAWHPIRGTAYWEEFAPLVPAEWEGGRPKGDRKKLGKDNWRGMAHLMIAKCAEAQALRRGWPEHTGGVHIEEEFDRVEADESATAAADRFLEQERLAKIGGSDVISFVFNWTEGLVSVPAGQVGDRILEHIGQVESADDLIMWKESNRVGLQQYWARSPSEALAIKKAIEDRIAELDVIPSFNPQ